MTEIERTLLRQQAAITTIALQPAFRRLVAEMVDEPFDVERVLALLDVGALSARGIRLPKGAKLALEISSTEEIDLTGSSPPPQEAYKVRVCLPINPFIAWLYSPKICFDITVEPKD